MEQNNLNMEKLKQHKHIIVVVLLILGFVFYWSELRPYMVKKACYKETLPKFYSDPNDNVSLWEQRKGEYDTLYALCLKKNGI